MSAIEKPTPIKNDNLSASDLRIRAMQLLLDVPDERLEFIIRFLQELHQTSEEQEAKTTDDPQAGTLGSLLRHALEANIFNDPDLDGDIDEYIENLRVNNEPISSD